MVKDVIRDVIAKKSDDHDENHVKQHIAQPPATNVLEEENTNELTEDVYTYIYNSVREQEEQRADEYDTNLEQLFVDNGIYPPTYANDWTCLPENWDEITEQAMRRRESVEVIWDVNEIEFSKLSELHREVGTEREVEELFFDITGKTGIDVTNRQIIRNGRYRTGEYPQLWYMMLFVKQVEEESANRNNEQRHIRFDMKPILDGCPTLPCAKPALYDGLPNKYLNKDYLKKKKNLILPAANEKTTIPNFFVELKGKEGSSLVAERQALYDGVLGTRAMETLRKSWVMKPETFRSEDGDANTIVSTYCSGVLSLYTVHLQKSYNHSIRKTGYYMNLIGQWDIWHSRMDFHDGVSAFRNLRDWATNKRYEFAWQLVRNKTYM